MEEQKFKVGDKVVSLKKKEFISFGFGDLGKPGFSPLLTIKVGDVAKVVEVRERKPEQIERMKKKYEKTKDICDKPYRFSYAVQFPSCGDYFREWELKLQGDEKECKKCKHYNSCLKTYGAGKMFKCKHFRDKGSLTERSKQIFLAYAKDCGNWLGTPLVGGNVPNSKQDCGNLIQLKKEGLIETWEERDEEPQGRIKILNWLRFTPKGVKLARKMGNGMGWYDSEGKL